MATTDSNGFITIENSDLFNISHANGNAAAASAVATRVTTAEGSISDIQTALGTKVDTSTYTAGMATKVNSSTYTAGMATKVDKVDGKGLSTEDYTSAEKTKLAGIAAGANNYSLPEATTSTLGGVIVGSGLSVDGGGVLSASTGMTVTHLTSPFGNIWLNNATALTATADAWLYGAGTAASPALCCLRAYVSYVPGINEGDNIWFYFNGYKPEKSVGIRVLDGISGGVFKANGNGQVGQFYVGQSILYAKITASTSDICLTATFPIVLN